MELAREIVRHGLDHLYDAVAAYEKGMLPRAKDFIVRCEESGQLMFADDSPRGFHEMLEKYKAGSQLNKEEEERENGF
jgi:hypothetical protein